MRHQRTAHNLKRRRHLLFLEKIILTDEKNFERKARKLSKTQSQAQLFTIGELKRRSFFIFVEFLGGLQSEITDPNCLTKYFPGLKDFLYRSQYILQEEGPLKLLKEFKSLSKLFYTLKDSKWKKNCQKPTSN